MEQKTENSQDSWQIALSQLKDAPNGTKLPYTAHLDKNTGQLIPRVKYQQAYQKYKTTETFIKFGGGLFKIPKGSLIGQGNFGKIKLKWDQQGGMSTVKIQKAQDNEFLEDVNREYDILHNLQLSKGMSIINSSSKSKAYIDMTYLGFSLEAVLEQSIELCDKLGEIKPYKLYLYLDEADLKCSYLDEKHRIQNISLSQEYLSEDYKTVIEHLKKKSKELPKTAIQLKEKLYNLCGFPPELDENTRLDFAISVCIELANLHEILCTAHGDVKTANIMINSKGSYLIDFGLSRPNPNTPVFAEKVNGSALYMPYTDEMPLDKTITLAQTDVFALKRVLYLPRLVYTSIGHCDLEWRTEFNYKKASLLTQSMIDKYKLAPYIDTSSNYQERKYYLDDSLSARALAAILIVAKLQLPIKYEELVKDEELSRKVVCDYENGPLNPYCKVVENKTDLKKDILISNIETLSTTVAPVNLQREKKIISDTFLEVYYEGDEIRARYNNYTDATKHEKYLKASEGMAKDDSDYLLGVKHMINKNYKEAVDCFKICMNSKNTGAYPIAANYLGACYEKGKGVEQNYLVACYYYNLCRFGCGFNSLSALYKEGKCFEAIEVDVSKLWPSFLFLFVQINLPKQAISQIFLNLLKPFLDRDMEYLGQVISAINYVALAKAFSKDFPFSSLAQDFKKIVNPEEIEKHYTIWDCACSFPDLIDIYMNLSRRLRGTIESYLSIDSSETSIKEGLLKFNLIDQENLQKLCEMPKMSQSNGSRP